MKRGFYIKAALVIALLTALSGCAKTQESLTAVLTEENFSQLDRYESLKTLDLSGSTCYGLIEEYAAAHPEVDITYTVDLGGCTAENTAEALTLEEGGYEYSALLENLRYLPDLTSVKLPETALDTKELLALINTYPSVKFDYSKELAGTVVCCGDSEVDLSALGSGEVNEAASLLSSLPSLRYVELTPASGQSALSMDDVALLQCAAPNAVFHYCFELFGKQVSTADTELEYTEVEIGNEGVDQIRRALNIMKNCTYVKLEDCGIDSETMASLRDDYPGIKVVWRVYFGYFTCLTDEETIRAIFDLDDTNCSELKYCTEVKYMDIGHNSTLHDVSFIAYMPKLEIVIISGSPFSDMSVFENHRNLIFLELVWCGNVSDLSSLESCPNLAYLNISYSKVEDLSPISALPLERFMYYGPKLSARQQQEFRDLQPDCWVTFEGENPYVLGWRYNDQGHTWCDMYLRVREVFRYEDNFYNHK